jgi:tRNA/tmRNA/rRNA uracil-C5-methylase (TrmA/RlmC/RlmD family)
MASMTDPGGKNRLRQEAADSERPQAGTLESFIRLEALRRRLTLPPGGPAMLARLDYPGEVALKEAAFDRFWRNHRLPGQPEALIASPMPRHYRTTSKRRVLAGVRAGKRGNIPSHGILRGEAGSTLLEPDGHAGIFAAMEELLSRQEYAPLAAALNFVIVRGTYDEFMVIFNLVRLDRRLHHLVARAAAAQHSRDKRVISAFLFIDPSRSPYYLESDRPRGSFSLKKLFGPDHFRLSIGHFQYLVPPASFSQVNETILPRLLAAVGSMATGEGIGRLLDLYCGYGLFALSLRPRYREVFAVDAAEGSVRAGVAMLGRFPGQAPVHFRSGAIARNSLERLLPPPLPPGEEDVVLDPPRRGADEAVINAIARRRPGRVIHLFCAADEIPPALAAWRRRGYFVRRAVPLDMFAGTPQLETVVLFTRA